MSELFNEQEADQTPAQAAPTVADQTPADTTPNPLEQILDNTGKPKFSDTNGLAQGYQHAQSHIQTLLQEKRELEAELEQTKTQVRSQEDLVAAVSKPKEPGEPVPQGLTPEDVEKLLTQREQAQVAQANLATVKEQLTQAYGEDFQVKVLPVLAGLGLGTEEANALAAKSPQAFLKLIGKEAAPAPTRTPTKSRSGFDSPAPPTTPRAMSARKTSDLVNAWKHAGTAVESKYKG